MAISILPGAAAGFQTFLGISPATTSADPSEPAWNTGNLCTSLSGLGTSDVNCVSDISDSNVPLTFNFSAGELKGGLVTVIIKGSNDCIYLNFHSFDTTLNVTLKGGGYACPKQSSEGSGSGSGGVGSAIAEWSSGKGSSCSYHSAGGWGWASPVEWSQRKKCAPGVNIVINSENDILNLNQTVQKTSPCGGSSEKKGYATNITIYGTTTVVNAVQWKGTRDLNTTVTYIGTKPGFAVCPSGITYGRVSWTEASWGSHNAFSTIFIDGTNVVHVPPNYAYFTVPLAPPAGVSYGSHNLYGNETTQTVPLGVCQYLPE